MYLIKQSPEDFVVEEILPLPLLESGAYSYWALEKRNLNTLDALALVAKSLRCKPQQLGHAGNKDKNAPTRQSISVYRVPVRRIQTLSLPSLSLSFLGFGQKPIHLGQHSANRFRIVVRSIDRGPHLVGKVLNLFGEQRFGGNNAEVGKALLTRRFQDACGLIGSPVIDAYLAEKPTDFVGALRTLPKQQLKLYVHAFQSAIWNECAREAGRQAPDTLAVPIVGFATDIGALGSSAGAAVLARERISPRDFIIRELPDISSEGGTRPLYMDVGELAVGALQPDEWHPGMKKCVVSFTLKPGSYATVLIDALFA